MKWSYYIKSAGYYGSDGYVDRGVTFCVYYKNEKSPLFHIRVDGFSNIDGYVQKCFELIDLDKHNYLKIIGVDLL